MPKLRSEARSACSVVVPARTAMRLPASAEKPPLAPFSVSTLAPSAKVGIEKSTIEGFHAIHESCYQALLNEFPEICNEGNFQMSKVKHSVMHHIITHGPPPKYPFRRLSPEMFNSAKKDFIEMQKAGFCRPSSSPYASPLHMVKKPDGSWRPCGDYRGLNKISERDNYPLPHIQDLVQRVSGGKIFSKIDLEMVIIILNFLYIYYNFSM